MVRVTTEWAHEILHAAARRGIEHVDEVAKLAADLIDARAENTRLAHLAGQTTGLILERDHYRERAQSLRARFDWAQSVAASAMRQGLAECRRLRARLADAAGEIDRHWSERRAVAVRVGCYPGSDLGREVGDMVDAVGALMVELKAACRDRDEARAERDALRTGRAELNPCTRTVENTAEHPWPACGRCGAAVDGDCKGWPVTP